MAHPFTAYMLKLGLLSLILIACLASFDEKQAGAQNQAGQAASEENTRQETKTASVDCAELAAMIQQEKSLISRETGQLKREIALLREDLTRPGIREIFAGIGYIFGLAGVGLYVHYRKGMQA